MPSLIFGVAFGNLFLGVPFHFDELAAPVYDGRFIDLLHPFALLAGVTSLAMLVDARRGLCRAEGRRADRPRARGAPGTIAAIVLLVAFIGGRRCGSYPLEGFRITGAFDASGPSNPLRKTVETATGAWLGGYGARAGRSGSRRSSYTGACSHVRAAARARPGLAFVASALATAGVILTAGFALFPFLLPSSTTPRASLTVWDASSSQHTLVIMLIATLLLLPIVLIYTSWVFYVLRGTSYARARAQEADVVLSGENDVVLRLDLGARSRAVLRCVERDVVRAAGVRSRPARAVSRSAQRTAAMFVTRSPTSTPAVTSCGTPCWLSRYTATPLEPPYKRL